MPWAMSSASGPKGGFPVTTGTSRSIWALNQGISKDAAKDLTKQIRDLGLKVTAQVQGDQVRVQGKKRDDLQQVIAAMKDLDFEVPLQYINFRD